MGQALEVQNSATFSELKKVKKYKTMLYCGNYIGIKTFNVDNINANINIGIKAKKIRGEIKGNFEQLPFNKEAKNIAVMYEVQNRGKHLIHIQDGSAFKEQFKNWALNNNNLKLQSK